MTSTSPVVCIVDAYSTGAELAKFFHARGWRTIHVQSTREILPDFRAHFKAEDFAENYVPYSTVGALGEIIQWVRRREPQWVIAGAETGVRMAESLADALGLPGNPPQSSDCRRNKYAMHEALKRAGVAHIEHCLASTRDEAVAWAAQQAEWPLVVKPVESGGSDSVIFCDNVREVEGSVLSLLGTTNRLGIKNKNVLLQQRLRGQQFLVNAVSVNGNHFFIEIWRDDKVEIQGASLIADREELLPFRGEEQETIFRYLRRVLDAVGIKDGPSHCELIVTNKGPVLVEVAARLQGTIMHEAVIDAIGYSHVTATVDRITNPANFSVRYADGYELSRNLYCVTLASDKAGVVERNHCREKIATLGTYYGMFHCPREGDRIEKTIDLFSNPGTIYLSGKDRSEVEADYKRIRSMEATGQLFDIVQAF